VFLVALIVRAIVAFRLWDLPLVTTPKLDSAEYVAWARRISSGDFRWPIVSPHGPGYPFFLAAAFTLLNGSIRAALSIQATIGAATAALIAIVASRGFGVRAGMIAGLAYGVYGPVVYVETTLLSEGLLLFLLTLALVLMSDSASKTAAGFAGATLGLGTLVRPTALFVVAALLLWIVFHLWDDRRRALTAAACFLAGWALLTTPALVKDWSVSHTLGVQAFGGLNFYIGNSPLHTGRASFRPGAGWDALNAEAFRAGITDAVSQDRYYVAKTLREIRAYPASFLRLIGQKSLWMLQAEEPRDSHSYYFFADQSRVLRWLPRMSILFPMACLGLVPLVRAGREASLLAFYSAGAALSAITLVVGTRYRMPIVPALAIASGVGLVAVWDAVRARHVRRLLELAAVGIAGLALSHVATDPRNSNLAEEWAFTGSSLITAHDLVAAEAADRKALALDPESGLAWDGLGIVLLNSRRLDEAQRAFHKALALDSDNARARLHLGLAAELTGDSASAIGEYRRALSLDPYDLETTRRLGSALLRTGRAAEALPFLRTAAEQAPADPEAHRILGAALGRLGQLQDGRQEMMRSLELSPSNGEAWLDLCLLSLDLRDVDAAANALQRAREEGADTDRLGRASAALERARHDK
jgi:tetratricopeptide (TPR) repeat protein